MRTVRTWEYTSRFGHLGSAQTSQAHNARVLEFFFDSYDDRTEAVRKAGLLLSIYEYIGQHAAVFYRKQFLENSEGGLFSVNPALLRAVHHIFTTVSRPWTIDPRNVVTLARAFEDLADYL